MPQMDADAPTKPFGGLDEIAVTADAKKLVFTCKDVGREEAWSTNFDLWEVPTDGSAAPKRITTNPAWDATPRFSPDGKTLAYLAMTRAGLRGRPVRSRPARPRDGQGPLVHAPRRDREERRPLAGRDHLVRRRQVSLRDRRPPRPESPLRDRRRERQGEDPRLRRHDRRPGPARQGPDSLHPPLAPRADGDLRDPGRRRRVREADLDQRREGRGGPLRQAGAVHVPGRQGRHGLRLHRPPGRLRPGEEVPRRLPHPRRAAGLLRQRLPLPLEPAGLRRRRLRGGDDRLPRLDRLRPGLHRRRERRLGRRALRGPDEGPRRRAREVLRSSTRTASAPSAPPTAAT